MAHLRVIKAAMWLVFSCFWAKFALTIPPARPDCSRKFVRFTKLSWNTSKTQWKQTMLHCFLSFSDFDEWWTYKSWNLHSYDTGVLGSENDPVWDEGPEGKGHSFLSKVSPVYRWSFIYVTFSAYVPSTVSFTLTFHTLSNCEIVLNF